jgi:hypothetical protein
VFEVIAMNLLKGIGHESSKRETLAQVHRSAQTRRRPTVRRSTILLRV